MTGTSTVETTVKGTLHWLNLVELYLCTGVTKVSCRTHVRSLSAKSLVKSIQISLEKRVWKQERFPKGGFNRMNNDSSGFSRCKKCGLLTTCD